MYAPVEIHLDFSFFGLDTVLFVLNLQAPRRELHRQPKTIPGIESRGLVEVRVSHSTRGIFLSR